MAITLDLGGQVVLVCGIGRGGIGGATARKVSEAGATVFAVDHRQELIAETMADIEQAGGRCEGMVADLTDAAQSREIVPEIISRLGRLDGVANVAGGTREHEWMRLEDTPDEIFRDVINLNLEYVFRVCRDAAVHMIANKTGGSLVNVASISALTSAPFHGPYGAAKSGISAITRTMALEWKPHGIRANTVSPGAVATERVTSRPGWGKNDTTRGGTMDLTLPDELAQAIVFLLSDLASGISGQNLVVDSALTTNYATGGSLNNFKGSIYDPKA